MLYPQITILQLFIFNARKNVKTILTFPPISSVKKEICRIKLEYVKIVSDEQRSTYAAEFEKDYEDYVRLKNKEKEVSKIVYSLSY